MALCEYTLYWPSLLVSAVAEKDVPVRGDWLSDRV